MKHPLSHTFELWPFIIFPSPTFEYIQIPPIQIHRCTLNFISLFFSSSLPSFLKVNLYRYTMLSPPPYFFFKIRNVSQICTTSLQRGHVNLLCIIPILVYGLPKRASPPPPLCKDCSHHSLKRPWQRSMMTSLQWTPHSRPPQPFCSVQGCAPTLCSFFPISLLSSVHTGFPFFASLVDSSSLDVYSESHSYLPWETASTTRILLTELQLSYSLQGLPLWSSG